MNTPTKKLLNRLSPAASKKIKKFSLYKISLYKIHDRRFFVVAKIWTLILRELQCFKTPKYDVEQFSEPCLLDSFRQAVSCVAKHLFKNFCHNFIIQKKHPLQQSLLRGFILFGLHKGRQPTYALSGSGWQETAERERRPPPASPG